MPVDDESPRPTADRCRECGHPLAHDQRYCTECGARRLALPTRIAVALAELADRHQAQGRPGGAVGPSGDSADEAGPGEGEGEGAGAEGDERPPDVFPAARAAAVSILLMLGVGSVIGAATTPGGVTKLASTIVVALSPTHYAPTRTLAAITTPLTGGNGGGRGQRTRHAGSSSTTAARTTTTTTSAPTTSTSATTSSPTPTASRLPPIHHVWEIVLSDQGYDQSFGTTTGHPYLSRTLARQGTLISNYDAVAGSSLANEIALISGQGPTLQTLQDCPQYSAVTPGRVGRHDQIRGTGCVYPSGAQTLGSELAVQGDEWRAFIQGVGTAGQRSTATTSTSTTTSASTTSAAAATTGTTSTAAPATGAVASPATATTTTTAGATTTTSSSSSGSTATTPLTDTSHAAGCPHPAQDATDTGQVSGDDDYVTWTNPWVYFDSVLDSTTCAHDDVGLGKLAVSLRHAATTPAFSYIAPDPCDDGSDTPCAPGAAAGLHRADVFLRMVVPKIERSAAYKAGGLILITFDEAPQSGPDWSTASCCGQPTYPNLKGLPAATGTATATTTTTSTTTTAPGTSTTGTSTTGTTTGATTTTSGPVTTGDPPGGGQVGLLMISPYVAAGKLDELHIYNHFSLLKTLAQLFGVTPPGYAADALIPALSPTLFTQTKR